MADFSAFAVAIERAEVGAPNMADPMDSRQTIDDKPKNVF
jgi:hypothetical protein